MYQRQEIFNIIELFTSQKLINFYTKIFDNLNLSSLPDKVPSKFAPTWFSRHALFSAFIVINCYFIFYLIMLISKIIYNLNSAGNPSKH